MDKRFLAIVAINLILVGFTVPLVSRADSEHLLITQVQITGGSGKTTNDFIEIYNPTSADIDLKGIRLVKRTKTGVSDTLIKSWTSPTIIKSKRFYLWANSSYGDITTPPDVTTTVSIADDNGVALRSGPNDIGVIIDSVAWGQAANIFIEGTIFENNPTASQSLERNFVDEVGGVIDTDNNASDFFLQTNPHPRNSQVYINFVAPEIILNPTPESVPEASISPEPSELPTPSPVLISVPSPSTGPIYEVVNVPTPVFVATPFPVMENPNRYLGVASPSEPIESSVVVDKVTYSPSPLSAVIYQVKENVKKVSTIPTPNPVVTYKSRGKLIDFILWLTHYLSMLKR